MKLLFSQIKETKTNFEKLKKLFKDTEKITHADILLYRPINYLTITKTDDIDSVNIGEKIITNVVIKKHIPVAYINKFSKKTVYQIIVSTDNGLPITLIFFKIFQSQIDKLKIGTKHSIQGKLELFGSVYKIVHPVIIKSIEEKTEPVNIEFSLRPKEISSKKILKPIYKLTQDISQNFINNIILKSLSELDTIDPFHFWKNDFFEKKYLPGFIESIKKIHNPSSFQDIDKNSKYRKRLALDEILASLISIRIARQVIANQNYIQITTTQKIRNLVIQQLPFELTDYQKKVIDEITQDQSEPKRMFRLLQGDVGSGKTIVALIAAINAIESKKHAAIIVPTTILAMQHTKLINNLLYGTNLNIELLTSKTTNKQYKQIQENLINNKIDILIGTHAVINDNIELPNFGIIIIDEQHRFGVKQRSYLFKKAHVADILMMTATPIPRTLAMMNYGDIEISVIEQKPKSRIPIDTRIINIAKYFELLESFKRSIENNGKIYWICPAVFNNETEDIASVEKRYNEFKAFFGIDKVGFIHGKMHEKIRDDVLLKFLSNEIKILVATTVVEVGIDISDVTIIAIEKADNFGLSQLHQLRGRVGRSNKKSYCFLLHDDQITESGKKRLKIIKETEDGFKIAEEDLKIRGSGDIIGIKQSGFRDFIFVNPAIDLDLFQMAHEEVKNAMFHINNNTKEKQGYLNLLKFFGYNETIDLLVG